MHTKYLGSTKGVTIDSPAGVAHISDTYNTGYMVGDTKLAALCDTETGSISAPELVTNGTFDTDISGWTGYSDGRAILSWESGKLRITNDAAPGHGLAIQSITTTPGKRYRFTATSSQVDGNYNSRIVVSSNISGSDVAASTVNKVGEKSLEFTAVGTITYIQLHLFTTELGPTVNLEWDNVSVKEVTPDRSGNNNHLNIIGTLNRAPIGNGEIAAWSGFSASNYLEMPYTSDLDFGTGDFCVMGWVNDATANDRLLHRALPGASTTGDPGFQVYVDGSGYLGFFLYDSSGFSGVKSPTIITGGLYHIAAVVKDSGSTLELSINGARSIAIQVTPRNVTLANAVCRLGISTNVAFPLEGELINWRISATAPTPDQIAKIYRDELAMIQGKATLDGNDSAVKALTYDKERDLLHVASQGVVSSFRGLERVESTLDGVPELVTNGTFDVDTSGWTGFGTNGSITVDPSGGCLVTSYTNGYIGATHTFPTVAGKTYLLTLDRGVNSRVYVTSTPGSYASSLINHPQIAATTAAKIYFTATSSQSQIGLGSYNTSGVDIAFDNISVRPVSPAAPFTSLDAKDGALILSGTNGVDVQLPEVNIRERLAKALHTQHPSKEDFEFTGDGTETTFTLNYGWKPKRVWVDGVKKRQGSAEDYTVAFDGFKYSVVFAVAPALNAEIDVEGVSV